MSADSPLAPLGSLLLKDSTQTGADSVASSWLVRRGGVVEMGFNAMAHPSLHPGMQGWEPGL